MKSFVITSKTGEPYLTRYVLSETKYLHIIHRSDDDRDLHDHPWDFSSQILHGSYVEVTPDGKRKTFKVGDVNFHKAEDAHCLVLNEGEVVTLVTLGPRRREWGFHTAKGWVHHKDYLDEKFGFGKWTDTHD